MRTSTDKYGTNNVIDVRMDRSPPTHFELFTNARDIQVGEQYNYNIHGNQYVYTSDQVGLLELLRPILEASHTRDRAKFPPNSACFPGTRAKLIKAIVTWADSTLLWNTHILWLYGFVGCGKSAIALAIALKFERRNRLVGSFFFFRNTGDRSRMVRFATTLAFQLAIAVPEAAPFIKRAATQGGLLASSLVTQLRRLVYEPFKAAVKQVGFFKAFFKPFLIVIDGLDECEDKQDVQAFIADMITLFEENPFIPLRFLITSRVEQHIEGQLRSKRARLEDLVHHCSRRDMDAFIQTCFEEEKKRNPVIRAYVRDHGDWPTNEDKDTLVDHIGGSFIFASVLFNYIVDPTDTQSTPMERLPHTLKMDPGLDVLYAKTLSRSRRLPHYHKVISTLALLIQPLSIKGLATLLDIETFEVTRVLINLQAIIHIPGTDDSPVTICHTSLRDFLTTESRSGRFFAPPDHHLYLSYRYLLLHGEHGNETAPGLLCSTLSAQHFEKFTPSPSAPLGTLSYIPQNLDDFHAYILARTAKVPSTKEETIKFVHILSIIALHIDPLSVSEISKLLEVEPSWVLRLLVELHPIIEIPKADDAPVTTCHTSFRKYLVDKNRSGPFFVVLSYHFSISYHYFILNLKSQLGKIEISPRRRRRQCDLSYLHWKLFMTAIDEGVITLTDHSSVPRTNCELSFSLDLFTFTQWFIWIFQDCGFEAPVNVLATLSSCLEFLAVALETDVAPQRWLSWKFHQVQSSKMREGFSAPLNLEDPMHPAAIDSCEQRIEAVLQRKV
ncbi:hypothetical protein MD484_g6820, partial [Candolleomyces efflorescens]